MKPGIYWARRSDEDEWIILELKGHSPFLDAYHYGYNQCRADGNDYEFGPKIEEPT